MHCAHNVPASSSRLVLALAIIAISSLGVSATWAQQTMPAEATASRPAESPATRPTSAATKPAATWQLREPAQTLGPSAGGNLLWQMIASIIAIAVLGGACYLVIKKLLPRIGRPTGRNVRLVETTWIGPNKSVHLLKVGRETLLVASSRDRVSMLANVTAALSDADSAGQRGCQ